MTTEPTTLPTSPRPRAVERTAVTETARTHLSRGGGVLLTGPAGSGRTTLAAHLVAELRGRGHRILRCSPSPAEEGTPFLGLIDLLTDLGDHAFAVLAPHERAVLEQALLRSAQPVPSGGGTERGPGGGRDALVLRIAVRKVLTGLCGAGPVLLVVDDAQWLDRPTADILKYLAPRADSGMAVLVTVRSEEGPGPVLAGRGDSDRAPGSGDAPGFGGASGSRRGADGTGAASGPGGALDDALELCPHPVRRILVPPMTAHETGELLARHDHPSWPGRLVARLHEASGGNPRTALELSAALDERVRSDGADLPDPAEPLPVPHCLRRPILDRIGALPARARRTLVVAAVAVRPTVRLLRRAGCHHAPSDLEICARHGLVGGPSSSDHATIRFLDPLTPLVLRAETPYESVVEAHRALADASDDPVERAHHIARLTAGPDPVVAGRLAAAATAARRRGAPRTAARLGQLAAEYTPAGQSAIDIERRLTAAEDAIEAGDLGFARHLGHEVLGDARRPADRVRAWNVVIDSCGQAMAEIADVFPEAVRDAGGDPELLAQLHYRMSWRAWMVGGSAARAHDHAVRAAGLAARTGDRRTEVMALTQQAALELFLGLPQAEATLAAALTAPHDVHAMTHHNGPLYLKHRFHLVRDELDEARTELRTLVYRLRQRGSADSLSQCLIGLAQVEIERGRCRPALTIARQSLRITEEAGLSQGPAWYAVALAETAGGSLGQALSAAEAAERHSEDDNDRLFLPRALHAAGRIRLFAGQHERAAELLSRTGALETAQGQQDPATRRWHADLAEALAATGAPDEAAAVLGAGRRQAERLGRPGVLATLDRAGAAINVARGEPARAAAALEHTAMRQRAIGYPLEEARTRAALGRVRRLLGDEAAARAAFASALRIFTMADARPWVAMTRAERDRAADGPTRGPEPEGGSWSDRLTSTERSVVARVAQGATNREIAAGLVVSVKTVEAALTRAYRKLGAKSRVDITRMVMASPTA
ncbi:LuxR family transcriptional regulator [Streptomyces sp. NBC_00083]|uniref:helix-turn-helix transcriptional regulator n=1 Tax=Streptomyces sp. NBC_00083 TaxID=2975647 RepID=UPI00224F3562|nr:LuxR family transcriptional regulator [Streptomyces sp. NBC_00083]MCX5387238.1 AAA family ATPase [Streptomyces sp. NBC_00083]